MRTIDIGAAECRALRKLIAEHSAKMSKAEQRVLAAFERRLELAD